MLSPLIALVVAAQVAPPDDGGAGERAATDDVGVEDDVGVKREVGADGEGETTHGISARVLFGAAGVRHGAPMVGAGVAYERDVADGLLALEVAFEVLSSPEAHAALLEFVAEKPIEVTDDIGIYFGGGPTIGYHAPLHTRAEVAWGAIGLIGVEYFLGLGFEVFVELDTALLMLPHPIVEADVGTGVMYRF